MEIQLQELIDKIKNKGIKQAEKNAHEIKKQAEKEAKEIITRARKEAQEIIEKAEKQAANLEMSGKQAINQAARDLILLLKTKIQNIMQTVIKDEVKSVLKQDILSELILITVKEWIKKNNPHVQILLSQKDQKRLEDFFKSKLAQELKKGVIIKPIPEIEAGFKIMEKDGNSYFNITESGIAECFSEFLNPKLASIIEQAADSGSKT